MAKQTINVGSSANDGTGDPNRTAFQKINANFTELYNSIPTALQYKFLLSQSGGDDPQTATSGTLTQGVTYEIVAFETGDDFTPSGAPNNTVGTKWIANGVAPTWSNGSEIGWNGGAPVVSVDITPNGIGNIWFEYVSDGAYFLKSNALFNEITILKAFANDSVFGGLENPSVFTATINDSNITISTTLYDAGILAFYGANEVLTRFYCELIIN